MRERDFRFTWFSEYIVFSDTKRNVARAFQVSAPIVVGDTRKAQSEYDVT